MVELTCMPAGLLAKSKSALPKFYVVQQLSPKWDTAGKAEHRTSMCRSSAEHELTLPAACDTLTLKVKALSTHLIILTGASS